MRPPKTTIAIGDWISLPALSPFSTKGISAKSEVRAVIRIGVKRSTAAMVIDSRKLKSFLAATAVSDSDTEKGDETDNTWYADHP